MICSSAESKMSLFSVVLIPLVAVCWSQLARIRWFQYTIVTGTGHNWFISLCMCVCDCVVKFSWCSLDGIIWLLAKRVHVHVFDFSAYFHSVCFELIQTTCMSLLSRSVFGTIQLCYAKCSICEYLCQRCAEYMMAWVLDISVNSHAGNTHQDLSTSGDWF